MPIKTYKKRKVVVGDKIVDAQGKVWSKEAYAHMREYQTKYNKSRYRMYNIRFLNEDTEIIEYLNNLDSVNKYINDLVKTDLKKKKIIK